MLRFVCINVYGISISYRDFKITGFPREFMIIYTYTMYCRYIYIRYCGGENTTRNLYNGITYRRVECKCDTRLRIYVSLINKHCYEGIPFSVGV